MSRQPRGLATLGLVVLAGLLCPRPSYSAPVYKVLHSLETAFEAGLNGGLTLGNQGDLYGAAGGTVFRLAPSSGGEWRLTELHRFHYPGKGGAGPNGGLVLDGAGNLYGTAQTGGAHDRGTALELTPGSPYWKETVLASFCAKPNCEDGASPSAGLVMDTEGNLYGTAFVAYELKRGANGWKEIVLHDFTGEHGDGSDPFAGLILDANGNVYGTTQGGGERCGLAGCGTVYELSPQPDGKWKETILHRFDDNGHDGVNPGGGALLMDASGDLYGTTEGGGTYSCGGYAVNPRSHARRAPNEEIGNCGTIFRLRKSSAVWQETILHDFAGGASGDLPDAGVVMDKSGTLYGTTDGGGGPNGCGVLYKLAPVGQDKWKYSVLHTFGRVGDGCAPSGNLAIDHKGNLYGGTALGGAYGYGMVFELTP